MDAISEFRGLPLPKVVSMLRAETRLIQGRRASDMTAIRHALFARRPFCFWCGQSVWNHKGGRMGGNHATIEHLIPKQFGIRSSSPLVLACRCCNSSWSSASVYPVEAETMPRLLLEFCGSAQSAYETACEAFAAARTDYSESYWAGVVLRLRRMAGQPVTTDQPHEEGER